MSTARSLAEEYASQLAIHLSWSSESVLLNANELGRKAIGEGLSVLELINMHHDGLRALVSDNKPKEADAHLERAAAFLIEALSPFEMMVRGYRESIKKQRTSLDIFAHALAHDLKEPVRTIRSYLDLLAMKETLSAQGSEHFTRIQNAADRMTRLIDTVYFYTRLEGSPDGIGKETCDIVGVLQETKENIDRLIRERKAVIVHGALPRVSANRMQLLQVFQNLLSNAIHHCKIDPVIRIEAAEETNHWLFRVVDNGPGIDEAHRERIFEPFKRLTGHAEQGLGLGLAICQKIIESHGGRIWYEPAPQAGAMFLFTLPKVVANALSAPPASPAEALPENTVPADANALANVLLVDDNEADIALTQILLGEEANLRCNFLAAQDAYEAMTILRAEAQGMPRVDLVMLDINMPGMDGLELLDRMRSDKILRHVPVVMCTTSNADKDMQQAKSLGAVGYLTKPPQMAKLKPILENLSSLRLREKDKEYILSRAA